MSDVALGLGWALLALGSAGAAWCLVQVARALVAARRWKR